ncbi:hypothetical protein JW992_15490, partial [candidate division KSB1 bacterium]|nr:hypothetical protein [candidate division KSB1 bacterium]
MKNQHHPKIVSILLILLFGLLFPLSAQETDWVESTLADLSLEQKAGQLFIVEWVPAFANVASPEYRFAREMVQRHQVGGLIITGGTLVDIAVNSNALQKLAPIPLFINADLEVGLAIFHPWRQNRGWSDRLPHYITGGGTLFPTAMAIGATGNPDFSRAMG